MNIAFTQGKEEMMLPASSVYVPSMGNRTVEDLLNELNFKMGVSNAYPHVQIKDSVVADDSTYSSQKIESIAGGSHTYSTDEQIVGTWIDGKPLYQKTYSGSTPNSNSCQISDVDSTKIIHNACGRLYFTNSSIGIGAYLNASYYSGWYQDFTNNGILDIFYSNDYKNANYEITIQYTKST